MTSENAEKLNTLYDIYEQPMYRIAYAVLHDQSLAEDAVSDAFMRIMNKLDKFSDCKSAKTKAYIVKVIKSTSINIYHKNKRRFTEEVPISEAMQIADTSQRADSSDDISEILSPLNETDRNIVILRCVKDMSWKEVADRLSLTESNVRKRFERTKKRLNLKGEISDEK